MGTSYRFIYKEEREPFKEVLENMKEGSFTIDDYQYTSYNGYPVEVSDIQISISELSEVPNTKSAEATMERWDNVKWFSLRLQKLWKNHGVTHMGKILTHEFNRTTKVCKVKRPQGTFIIMRNGSNINNYNFLIYNLKKREYHFRQSIRRAHFIVDLLGMPKRKLPLLIDKNMDERDAEILQKLFQEI